jgi:hypothetical protein
MNTDDLIRALSEDAVVDTAPAPRLWPLLAGAAALSVAGLWLVLGPRDDLGAAMTSAPVLRQVLALALFGLAALAALRLARPEGRQQLWPLAAVPVAGAALVALTLATTPAAGWSMALHGKTQWACLISIPLLSVLPVAALLAALRQGASPAPALSGALAGLAGGGIGAAIYAMHCIEDSPLFWVTWYGTAILVVTGASALIGARLLRW